MIPIFVHQLHDHLLSLRFQIGFVVTVCFFATNGVLYGLRFDNLQREVSRIERAVEDRYERIETVAQATGHWYQLQNRPPGTEFIAEGGIEYLNSAAWISPESGQRVYDGRGMTRNEALGRFDLLDWTMIVRFVLSFLCIVLAYDAISGELQDGTLRLLLANPISR